MDPDPQTAASGPVPAAPETADAVHIMEVKDGMKNQQMRTETGSATADAAHIRTVTETGKETAVDYFEEALGEALGVAEAGNVITQAPSRKTRSLTESARASLLATFFPPAFTVTAPTGTVTA